MEEYTGWVRPAGASAGASGAWEGLAGAGVPHPHSIPHVSANAEPDPETQLLDAPRYWLRDSAGHPILIWFALAHLAAGLFGAIAGALVWYFVLPRQTSSIGAALAALLVAVAGAGAFQLARAARPEEALTARVLLPAADLIACAAALWLLGNVGIAPLLFVIPVIVAALLLSWRAGTILAALAVVAFATVSALRLGAALEAWVPQTLALACVATLLALCAGVFSSHTAAGMAVLVRRAARLRAERDLHAAEQERLLEGLALLEETQARLERERGALNAQMAELAAIAARLAQGDLNAARTLHSGMYGPLDVLAAALMRMTQQMGALYGAQREARGQQRLLESIAAGIHEQSRLLAATDVAVRDLSSSANALIAEVQVLGRGSGELPGVDRHVLFSAMRGVERKVIAQATDTATLGAHMAQLRGRQADLESEIQRASQASGLPQSGDLVNRVGPSSFAASGVHPIDSAGLPAIPAWEPPAGTSR